MIDLTGAYYITHSPYAEILSLHYFLDELRDFRHPSAKVPQDYQLQKGFCLLPNGKVEPEQ